MKEMVATVLGIFMLVLSLAFMSMCQGCVLPHAVTYPVQDATPVLSPGLIEACGVPDQRTDDGEFWLDVDFCMHTDKGLASCTYVADVIIGGRMLCMLGVVQESCQGPWHPVRVECTVWDDKFGAYLDKVRQQ